MHAPFPWIWFAPVLIALRYGTLQGLFSAILIIATFLIVTPQPWQSISDSISIKWIVAYFTVWCLSENLGKTYVPR